MFLGVNSDNAYIAIRNLSSLKHLSLSSSPGMLNESLMNDLFDQFPNIEILHLHGTFPYFNLDRLFNLKHLLLNGEINESFNFDLFKNLCKQLEILMINNIDYEILLKLFADHKFSNLEYLELSDCNIKIIEKKLIDHFAMLKELCIIRCNLEMMEDNVFSNLKHLLILDLSENNFVKLESKMLSELINLEYFSIRENRLQFIEQNVFSKLKNLKQVDLRNNISSTFELESFKCLGS